MQWLIAADIVTGTGGVDMGGTLARRCDGAMVQWRTGMDMVMAGAVSMVAVVAMTMLTVGVGVVEVVAMDTGTRTDITTRMDITIRATAVVTTTRAAMARAVVDAAAMAVAAVGKKKVEHI